MIWGILLLFFSLGVGYSYYTPLWNPPDEIRHFAYCEYIARNHKLPPLQYNQEGITVTQAFHPPLYYLLASFLYRNGGAPIQESVSINDGPGFNTIVHPRSEAEFPYAGKARTAHLMRLFSLALSTLNIYFIYLLAVTIFPGETALAATCALFVAMNAQFLHIAASVSNETLSSTLSTIYLFVLIRFLNARITTTLSAVAGVLLGCCLISKTSTLFYLPLTAGVIAWACLHDRRKLIISLFTVVGTAASIGGWWYIRNWFVLNDPLLTGLLATFMPLAAITPPISVHYLTAGMVDTFISFFGHFGALQFSIPRIYLSLYGGIMLLGAVGCVRLFAKRELTPPQMKAMLVLIFTLLGGAGVFITLNLKYIGSFMGRYLFTVIAPISLLTIAGLHSLLPRRWRNAVLSALSILLITVNLDILFGVVKPAYAPARLTEGAAQASFSYPTPELSSAAMIAQTFTAAEDNLCAIRVMFSSPAPLPKGEVVFALAENRAERTILHMITASTKKIEDCTELFFIFPPISNAKGKEYIFWFTSSLPQGSNLALWSETKEAYPDGHLVINGMSAEGALRFTTYHFTGSRPVTLWQGRKETVIAKRSYIDIPEWQLYVEQSKGFREKSITHEKLLRVQKAIATRAVCLHKEN